jgi:transcriptional regulator with XRE-family HTH domain
LGRHLRSASHRALIAAIVEARKAAGMSQREFARKLSRSDNFVWRIEAGERQVNVLEFFDIAKAAGITPDTLTRRVMRSMNVSGPDE